MYIYDVQRPVQIGRGSRACAFLGFFLRPNWEVPQIQQTGILLRQAQLNPKWRNNAFRSLQGLEWEGVTFHNSLYSEWLPPDSFSKRQLCLLIKHTKSAFSAFIEIGPSHPMLWAEHGLLKWLHF